MVDIRSDSNDIERHLLRLVELVQAGGGFIHEDVIITCNGGGLSVEAPASVEPRTRLLEVPQEILLPIDGFGLHLEGDDICLRQPEKGITAQQVALMEEMAAIYNLCGKVAAQREHSPARLFKEAPEVFERLAFPNQVRYLKQVPEEDFYLHDFIHTRQFGAKMHDKKSTDADVPVKGPKDKRAVLMPVIDFLNHHQYATGFIMKEGVLSVNRASPVSGSDECYVSYSLLDAQAAFFTYGFVDKAATFALSIPFKIDLPGVGTIGVRRALGNSPKKLAGNLKDLTRFVPPMGNAEFGDGFAVGFLIIPDARFPRAMRRILQVPIQKLAGFPQFDRLASLVEEAERQVIAENRSYYESALEFAAEVSVAPHLQPILDGAAAALQHQLDIIASYEQTAARLSASA